MGSAEGPRLEPEQEQLLIPLVRQPRDIPRDRRESFLLRSLGGDEIQGGNLASPISSSDVEHLGASGLLRIHAHPDGTQASFTVTPEGLEHYAAIRRHHRNPTSTGRRSGSSPTFESADFRSACPAAFQRWREAEELLWVPDSGDHLTAMSSRFPARRCRSSPAPLVTTSTSHMIARSKPTDAGSRLGSLADACARLVKGELSLLNGLFEYWRAAVDLVRRQETVMKKEGEPLGARDGRRVVFQTANVMVELHRATEQAATGFSATTSTALNNPASGGSVAATDPPGLASRSAESSTCGPNLQDDAVRALNKRAATELGSAVRAVDNEAVPVFALSRRAANRAPRTRSTRRTHQAGALGDQPVGSRGRA